MYICPITLREPIYIQDNPEPSQWTLSQEPIVFGSQAINISVVTS